MSFDLRLINGDLSILNGDLEQISGGQKLIQDILKITITKAGSNPFAPWYGSYLERTLIGSVLDEGIIVGSATSQLQIALSTLQSMQVLQLEAFQRLTADEQLAAILDISIARSPLDPRLFDVRIKALSKSYKKVDTSFTVSTF